MRPTSRIIQLVADGELTLCLCEDGSVWTLDVETGRFSLVTEMDGDRYVKGYVKEGAE